MLLIDRYCVWPTRELRTQWMQIPIRIRIRIRYRLLWLSLSLSISSSFLFPPANYNIVNRNTDSVWLSIAVTLSVSQSLFRLSFFLFFCSHFQRISFRVQYTCVVRAFAATLIHTHHKCSGHQLMNFRSHFVGCNKRIYIKCAESRKYQKERRKYYYYSSTSSCCLRFTTDTTATSATENWKMRQGGKRREVKVVRLGIVIASPFHVFYCQT